jgi:hypothetical protein
MTVNLWIPAYAGMTIKDNLLAGRYPLQHLDCTPSAYNIKLKRMAFSTKNRFECNENKTADSFFP